MAHDINLLSPINLSSKSILKQYIQLEISLLTTAPHRMTVAITSTTGMWLTSLHGNREWVNISSMGSSISDLTVNGGEYTVEFHLLFLHCGVNMYDF